jgi:two-component sensor histidine kinase
MQTNLIKFLAIRWSILITFVRYLVSCSDALSTAAGRVGIAWTVDDAKQRLRLTWTERGRPPVQRPTRRSFGTRMMESLGQQLNGQVQLSYDPAGFVYFLDVPLSSIIAAV